MADTILEFKNITKLYPGVTALDNVSLSIERGEIHALAGENGAGKSTLIKTLSGAIKPSAGTISFDGKTFDALNPEISKELGIAVVYQELMLVPSLTVTENIYIGNYIKNGMFVDMSAMEAAVKELFRKLDIDLDPSTRVEQLTTGYQQIVEIAKAVSKNAKLIVMDEPSAPLTEKEVEGMMQIVKSLKEQGVTIIYISHRLDEIFQIADRVTVLRDGQFISTKRVCDTTQESLIHDMVGRPMSETYPDHSNAKDDVVLKVRDISGNGVEGISFELHRGEILGLGGLIGAGRTELAEILFGYRKLSGGSIEMKGKDGHFVSCKQAVESGLSLVPEDRKTRGVIQNMSIRNNVVLPSLKKLCRFVFPIKLKEQTMVASQIHGLAIKTPSEDQLVRNLSGGNQQKVVLAKWLGAETDILILDEPTRGIDVGAKQELYNIMVELTKQDKSIIMISSDMQELLGMSDRIVVLCKGRLVGEIDRKDFSQERVLQYAAGLTDMEIPLQGEVKHEKEN